MCSSYYTALPEIVREGKQYGNQPATASGKNRNYYDDKQRRYAIKIRFICSSIVVIFDYLLVIFFLIIFSTTDAL